ncbi:MAG: phosphogluconate dehydratase, partial [Rhodobacter sp.]|nr:phosphogluconate dehydratase [Rhodobacter sp.]
KLRDGDIIRLDADAGTLTVLAPDFDSRTPITVDLSANEFGIGRELFAAFRRHVGPAETGGAVVV